jgi:hypothetical protein
MYHDSYIMTHVSRLMFNKDNEITNPLSLNRGTIFKNE